MPETPPERPRRKRLDNSAWRGGGYAMTTSLVGQGDSAPRPRRAGRMAGVMDRVRSATFLLDADGVIREFRHDAELLLGRCRETVLGTPLRDLVAAKDRPAADALVARVRAGDDARDVLDVLDSHGEPVRVDLHI